MKRFYESVEVIARDGAFEITLDGRPVRTPAKAVLAVPGRRLAEAIAEEWVCQDDFVRPETMLLTRLASTAIDGTTRRRGAVIESLVAYGSNDMICYRAEEPEDLVLRQTASWQPLLDWIARAYDVRLIVTSGLLPVAQPEEALAALRRAIAEEDSFRLTALHAATTATGSLVIALAIRDHVLDLAGAWEAAQIDETFQKEFWGADTGAEARRAAIRAELAAAVRLLELTG